MAKGNPGAKSSDQQPEIEMLFEEEIKKPYYKVDYLDSFKLPYERLDVSVIIPTRNRCPYKPNSLKRELNPLAWILKSALLQKPHINELIIIDDGGKDYTSAVVDSFREEAKNKNIHLVYLKNDKRCGIGKSRNIGSKAANSKFLLFADDDLIMSPYSAFGGIYTFELIAKTGDKIGMVGLPTYFRQSFPAKAVPKKEIGDLNFVKGTFTGNKDALIEEQLQEKNKTDKFIDNELNILKPIRVQNANAFCICLKQAFEDAGGFSEVIIRGEDREFGCKLIENGYNIYFSPDPKFHCVHGSYGLKTGKVFEGDDWFRRIGGMISLRKTMDECDRPNIGSGMRVDIKDYIYHQIFSFFCLVYPRNKKGAINWIKKVHEEFVKEGRTELFGNTGGVPPLSTEERKEIWMSAINQGLRFIKGEEKKGIKKINDILKKIQEKEKLSTDFISVLELLK